MDTSNDNSQPDTREPEEDEIDLLTLCTELERHQQAALLRIAILLS